MDLKQRIKAFAKLGNYLSEIADEFEKDQELYSDDSEAMQILRKAEAQNGWFTRENIVYSLRSWASALTMANLEEWTSHYNLENPNPKTVAVIMAGNIPLVGFHDFLSVLISGNKIKVKLSSNDQVLIPHLSEYLIQQEPKFMDRITFVKDKLEDFEAVIATGSNNTARYFDYYFGAYPHIIRRNRNSVAVLSGNETEEDLENLADDIFLYFGLGCRNVSKIYVPEDYNFEKFFRAVYKWKDIINNNKYINNYDYNKAVYLMEGLPLLDNEFLILKEEPNFSSPIGVLFYEKYSDIKSLKEKLSAETENIQCIVSDTNIPNSVYFGTAQKPKLTDYADGIDVMEFLQNLQKILDS